MYLHIVYNDGSNPFFMINATLKEIEKELTFQLSPFKNLYNIKFFDINGNITTINATKKSSETRGARA